MHGEHTAVRPVMLGRERELAQLEAALGDSRAGRGRVVLVGGDAGIGKTTLVRALAEVAEPTDVTVRWGKSWEDGGAPAYWPWIQVLRAQAAETDDESLARQLGPGTTEIAQLVTDVGSRLGITEAPPVSTDVQGARFRLFDAVSSFLRAASAEAPLLVILEDLHAADEPSLSLLQFLARELDRCPLLVVGTYREAEARSSPRRDRLLTAVAREGNQLRLGGLGPESVAALLEEHLARRPAETLVRQVEAVTEGNPFFVREVAHELVSRRAAVRDRLPLPDAVQAAVRTRLDRMAADVRAVLAVAAVIGREFDVAPVCRVTGQQLGPVLDALDEARRGGAVEEVGLNRWSFVHALVGETLYDAIPLTERMGVHRAVAVAFEELRPDAVAEIAHHRVQTLRLRVDVEAAVSACQAAADQAASVLAFEEAEAWYERALEALDSQPEPDDHRRCELLCALAECRVRSGSRQQGRETYRQAHDLARRLGWPDLVGRAALGFAGIPGGDSLFSPRQVLEEALATLPETDSALRARVLGLLGHFLGWELAMRSEPPDVGDRLCRAGIEMARRVADAHALAEALWNWHLNVSEYAGTLEERLRVADELVELAVASGDRERAVLARVWRMADRFEAADIAGARAELAEAAREAHELRLPFLLWNVTFPRATLALLEGRYADAERLTEEADALGRRVGFLIAETFFFTHRLMLLRERGRFAEAEELCRQAVERFPMDDDAGSWHSLCLAETGRFEEARAVLQRLFPRSFPRGWRVPRNAFLADVCGLLGERERAAPLYDALLPFAGRHVAWGVMGFSLGAVDRYLGVLATLMDRFNDAEAHFEAAHRLHERLGARPWAARGHADHARMLLARGGPGDRERASALLEQARQCFEALGATPHAERVRALLEEPERTSFRCEGEEWLLEYEGATIRLRDSKGLQYLARLLAAPGKEVHALELVGGRVAPERDRMRERLQDLKAEIEEARADHDEGRIQRAEDQFDDLVARLQGATQTPDAERARQSVSRAVKGAIDRIEAGHPALGEHLRTTVRTGMYSSYTPDARSPIEWVS